MSRGRVLLASVLAAATVACSTGATATLSSPSPPPASKVDVVNPFDPKRPFVFGGGNPATARVRSSSRALAASVHVPTGVTVKALPSTPETTVVEIVEHDPRGKFGDLLAVAMKAVFERYTADKALGPWLILVSGLAGQNSALAPPVADRWRRSLVEAYIRCGIPASRTNDCKSKFYTEGTEVTLYLGGGRGSLGA